MGEKKKKRKPYMLGFAMVLMLACYFTSNLLGIYEKIFGEADVIELTNDKAREFLFNDFGLELPQNSNEIYVTRYGNSGVSLRARVSFKASADEMTLWLNSGYTCNLAYSFEESTLQPIHFEWDDAPDWWQPETASDVILQHGCVVPIAPHLITSLIATDDSETWIAYLYISFP